MGNVCPCPAFFKRQSNNKTYVYDVHQETFDMEDTVKSQNIEEISPKNQNDDHDDHALTDDLRLSEEAMGSATSPEHQKLPQIPIENRYEQEHYDNHSAKKISMQIKEFEEEKQSTPLLQQQLKPEPISEQKPNFAAHILKPKTIKKKYNPDDYRYKDQNDTFKVKKIGTIKEQQYNIDNCHGCTFFIFDVTANLYIDDSTNCTIFVAPCESTIFVRNCKNITLIAATKQFRTYQCHQCTFSLYCKSQPVIQSSSQLKFTSFDAPIYPELFHQFRKERLEPWNNHWSEIHNFTKKSQEIHYTLHKNIEMTIDWKRAFEEAELIFSQENNPVPFINGELPYESQREILLLINKDVQNTEIISALKGMMILRAFQGVLPGEGKQQKKVLVVDVANGQPEAFEELGKVFTDPQQIENNKAKWLASFGDERNQ